MGDGREIGVLPRSVLDAARKRDAAAFTAIIRHYDSQLRGLVWRTLGSSEHMDDVMQDAALRAFLALPSFQERSTLGTWLHRITYRACVDHLRRSGRRPEEDYDLDVADPRDLETEVGELMDLGRALATLPPQHRALVFLVYQVGFDYETAAHILDVPPGTASSRLAAARMALRAQLAPCVESKGGAS